MTSERFASGDVVWAPNPYGNGGGPRPWLVVTADGVPYAGEEYVCLALTTSDLPDNVRVDDDDWVLGRVPDVTSYCSPWVIATVKHDAVAEPQGELTASFTSEMAERAAAYLEADVAP